MRYDSRVGQLCNSVSFETSEASGKVYYWKHVNVKKGKRDIDSEQQKGILSCQEFSGSWIWFLK